MLAEIKLSSRSVADFGYRLVDNFMYITREMVSGDLHVRRDVSQLEIHFCCYTEIDTEIV